MSTQQRGPGLLRARLEELGWTQTDLSKRIGVSSGVVSRWLSGERSPELEMAFRVQDEIGVPASAWRLTESGTNAAAGTDDA